VTTNEIQELRALIDQLEKVFVHRDSGFVNYVQLIEGMREALAALEHSMVVS
jgi:hypothetical protein